MKLNIILHGLGFCLFVMLNQHVCAQVSVYDCEQNQVVSPNTIYNSGPIFQANCIVFPASQNYVLDGQSNKTIQASKKIKIEPGFQAGPHTSNGLTHLMINKSDFNVASMDYYDLNSIWQLEKFELGIQLPEDLQIKTDNFVNEANVAPDMLLNPFHEKDIRIIAHFEHISSGETKQVDAFYFMNYVRDDATNRWKDEGTDYDFRVRFAPKLIGKWKCVIHIYLNNNHTIPVYASAPFKFNVVPSSNKGFVQIHSNGKNLKRGNSDQNIIFPVGTNLFEPGSFDAQSCYYIGNNEAPVYTSSYYTKNHWEGYLDELEDYADMGGKFFRFIVSPAHSLIEFEKLGDYSDRLFMANEMDNMVNLAHQKDMLIHFNLFLHTPIMKHSNYGFFHWDFSSKYIWNGAEYDEVTPYCYAAYLNSDKPSDMIANPVTFEYIKQRYRYYISRYGYSTNIELFELMSEPWWMDTYLPDITNLKNIVALSRENSSDGDLVRSRLQKFHTELAEYIKTHLHHEDHLIASSGSLPGPNQSPFPETNIDNPLEIFNVNDLSWSSPYIDIITITEYSNSADKCIPSKSNPEIINIDDNHSYWVNENSYAKRIKRMMDIYHKPLIFAETGQGDDFSECSSYRMHAIDAFKTGFSGLAGFNMWEGWDYRDATFEARNHNVLWPPVIRVQNHLNGAEAIAVFNSDWIQGREVFYNEFYDIINSPYNYLIEQQYILHSDKEKMIGYIYSRSYNSKTLNVISESNCQTVNNNNFANPVYSNLGLELQGLKINTDYNIDFYDSQGNYISSDCFNTTFRGSHKLQENNYPTLSTVNPIYWYVVHQRNCDKSLQLSENTIDFDSEIMVQPNPSSGIFNLTSKSLLFDTGTVEVTDAAGKQIISGQLEGGFCSLNLSEYENGIYFIVIRSEQSQKTLQVIKN